jgi:hypothetical protein
VRSAAIGGDLRDLGAAVPGVAAVITITSTIHRMPMRRGDPAGIARSLLTDAVS